MPTSDVKRPCSTVTSPILLTAPKNEGEEEEQLAMVMRESMYTTTTHADSNTVEDAEAAALLLGLSKKS